MSIWFINIKGITDAEIVGKAIHDYNEHKQLESKKAWLHLTRKNFFSTDLLKSKGLESMLPKLENPIITEFYHLIMNGEFIEAGLLVKECAEKGFLNNYLNDLPYIITWKRIDYMDQELNDCIKSLNYDIKLDKSMKKFKFIKTNLNLNSDKQNIGKKGDVQDINELLNEEEMEEDIQMEEDNELDELRSKLSGYSDFFEFMGERAENNNLKEEPSLNFCNSNLMPFASSKMQKVENSPSCRGGHSMVIDEINNIIYLFGGWNGSKDLSDFWSFDIIRSSWRLISNNTHLDKGPSARSCHKMVYDHINNRIILYGRYGEDPNEKGGLWEYQTLINKWSYHPFKSKIHPTQVYDHQMVLDENSQIIYIFGGILVSEREDSNIGKYLGLWKVDLSDYRCENLMNEIVEDPFDLKLKTRAGHSMVFNQVDEELIIIGGSKSLKEKKSTFFDLVTYNIKNRTIKEIFHDFSKDNGPDVNFSSCYFYNQEKNEMYCLGGAFKNEKQESLSNDLWSYNFKEGKWKKSIKSVNKEGNYDFILANKNHLNEYFNSSFYNNAVLSTGTKNSDSNLLVSSDTINIPPVRFAHAAVYSTTLNKGFLFGGNPNIKNQYCIRLSDFWTFDLKKKTQLEQADVILCKLYKFYFMELCSENKISDAFNVLSKYIVPVHNNNEGDKETIKNLSKLLIKNNKSVSEEEKFSKRNEFYEEIIKFISSPN
jgi:hypothetical protein